MCVPWELNPQSFVLLTQCSNHWATETAKAYSAVAVVTKLVRILLTDKLHALVSELFFYLVDISANSLICTFSTTLI